MPLCCALNHAARIRDLRFLLLAILLMVSSVLGLWWAKKEVMPSSQEPFLLSKILWKVFSMTAPSTFAKGAHISYPGSQPHHHSYLWLSNRLPNPRKALVKHITTHHSGFPVGSRIGSRDTWTLLSASTSHPECL